jgi:hypothetical protein
MEVSFTIIRSQEPPHNVATTVLCLDLTSLGVEGALAWLDTYGRPEGSVVVAAVGPGGYVLGPLVGRVDAIVSRPSKDTFAGWRKAFLAAVTAVLDPDHRDDLPREKTIGNVSPEAFAETLAQGALPSADPNKRD